jgi:hypothetical protein
MSFRGRTGVAELEEGTKKLEEYALAGGQTCSTHLHKEDHTAFKTHNLQRKRQPAISSAMFK